MGVNHRGLDVFMTEQVLYGTDVITGGQQVCGKAMAESMRAGMFFDAGGAQRQFESLLQHRFGEMMPPDAARCARVLAEVLRRKNVLPFPLARCVRKAAISSSPISCGWRRP